MKRHKRRPRKEKKTTATSELNSSQIDNFCNSVIWVVALWPLARFVWDVRQGFDFLIYQYLADDAFYYFQISRHIPEFNEGIANSGFHPLYAMIISPLHILLDYQYAIPISLFILILCYCAGTIVLYRILSANWSKPIALLSGAAWAVSGKLYCISMIGVETMLAALLVLLFFWQLVRFLNRPQDADLKWHGVLFGVTAGAAFLARLDSPIIIAPAGIYVTYRLLRAKRMKQIATLSVSAFALPVSWMIYIYTQTGHFFPTSGAAIRALRGYDQSFFLPQDKIVRLAELFVKRIVEFFAVGPYPIDTYWMGAVIVGVIIAGVILRKRAQGSGGASPIFEICAITGLICWASYYLLFQGSLRYWYFAHVGVGIFGIVLPCFYYLLSRLLRRPQLLLIVGSVAAVCIGVFSNREKPFAPQEYDKYQSALAANELWHEKKPRGNIGSFNTGIYNYFMDADVINLDGVVNPEALAALKNNDLPKYIRTKNIRYLIEHDIGKAANFHRIYRDRRFKLSRVAYLTDKYKPFGKRYAKKTYLWKVEVRD